MTDIPITKKVIDWNAKRYDQVFDYELATNLLLEEIEELYQAPSVVDKLDAIGDIIFVAIGVMWKLGFTEEQIYNSFYSVDLRELSNVDLYHYSRTLEIHAFDIINHEVEGAWPGFNLAMHSVFLIAIPALKGLDLNNILYDVVHAICDSNNTKEVRGKTAANVKANIVKGLSYKPPTEKLLELYIAAIKANQLIGGSKIVH